MTRELPQPCRPCRASWRILLAIVVPACGANVDLGGGVDAAPDTAREAAADSGGTCPTFAAPSTSAPCEGCDKSDPTCQPNGCFNGYFCDSSEPDCKAPGTPCGSPDAR